MAAATRQPVPCTAAPVHIAAYLPHAQRVLVSTRPPRSCPGQRRVRRYWLNVMTHPSPRWPAPAHARPRGVWTGAAANMNRES